MAIVKSGPYVGFSGTIDGTTYYQQRDGRTIAKRKNGKRTVPPTVGQLSVEADTKILISFMKPLERFIQVGFGLAAQKLGMNAHNAMVKTNRKKVIQGTYPYRSINYAAVLLSLGDMPVPLAAVKMTEEGLAFSWDTGVQPGWTHLSDQVMMLAYFPELRECRFVAGGNERHHGKDVLPLAGIQKGFTAEIYMAFASDDRSSISNSVHLGNLIW